MEFLKEEQNVDSKETFIQFMDALIKDWQKNHELIPREYGADIKITGTSWKNCYLLNFLEAMKTRISESEQLPSDFPYRELARMLSAATMYQGNEIKSKEHLSYRLNCWEVKKCGREKGGRNVAELGICPASAWEKEGEFNHGKNGGRICWVLVGTLCGGKIQGIFAEKIGNCLQCDFYKYVRKQEGENFRYELPKQKSTL